MKKKEVLIACFLTELHSGRRQARLQHVHAAHDSC